MNRHTIPPKPAPPYTNGHYETPLEVSGVSLRRPAPVHKPTVFPPDLPLAGIGPILYGLHRFQLAGIAISRYIGFVWLAIALLAVVGVVPGRWLTVALALLLWGLQIAIGLRRRRRHYVTFTSAPLPTLTSTPLDPAEKLPIYATGLLSVEGHHRHYSALPGFYRTFATGEHAILCRVPERKWFGTLSWPADETGMWYAFINPSDVLRLTWGTLQFGVTNFPALAVEYRLEIPRGPRRKQAEMRQELLYLASPEQADLQRLYMDMLQNLPQDRVAISLSPPQS